MFTMRYPSRAIWGSGSIAAIGKEALRLGDSALVVCGSGSLRRSGTLDRVLGILRDAGLRVDVFEGVEAEPSLETVRRCQGRLTDLLHSLPAAPGSWRLDDSAVGTRQSGQRLPADDLGRHQRVVVIGIGGGSALDVAKAAAGLAHEEADVGEYVNGRAVTRIGVPFIAVPTTAGSGAEATLNAVLTDTSTGVKQSIRSDTFLAETVILDPDLTLSLPPQVTAWSGMDALTQAIEGYTSNKANELTRPLSAEGVRLIGRNIVKAYMNGHDLEARSAMLTGSFLTAVAFASCRLGAVHGMAHPVGVRCHVAHGLVCAILLPYVMRFNLQVCADDYASLSDEIGLQSSGTSRVRAAALISHIEKLNETLGIPPRLGLIGLRREDIDAIADESMPSGSLAANPRPMTKEDVIGILRENL